MRILLIEDSLKLAPTIKSGLEQHGYSVDVANSAERGDELALVEHYDLILLDVMLGDRDGVELCRALRRQKVSTPIMMLTVLGSTTDKVRGLDAGADDYLTKPFELEELLARLRSLLRRATATEGALLCSGDMVLDLYERRLTIGGVAVKVSAKEFALLEYLMRSPRKLLTRAMISESVWDMNYEAGSNVIDVYVSTLRCKIDKGRATSRIETVIGSGYRFAEADTPGDAVSRATQAT